ncbi:MAG: hypothetical protein HOP30_14100 [Cyclobacteriaceae bacterium]|nr:hypothetical protein [Cyclobacteriaceae bacterium]
MKSITSNLHDVFYSNLDSSNEIFLISPFICLNVAKTILESKGNRSVRLLTRFDLNDFSSGVSSILALEVLHSGGVVIRGLCKLHAKTYLFDRKAVITSSANLTNGGFFNNYEHGILFDDPTTIDEAYRYFLKLWSYGKSFQLSDAASWKKIIQQEKDSSSNKKELPDYGGIFNSEIVTHQSFVKWLGTASDRASLDTDIHLLLEEAGCNYAVCFSHHPNRYKDGDQIFISIMTDTRDYAIFGRARAYAHVRGRDEATDEDKDNVGWKKKWQYYIRIYDVEFLSGDLHGCPFLYNDIVNNLDYDSFQSTQDRYLLGEDDINTKSALGQKQDVRLTTLASVLLNQKFDKAKASKGLISPQILNQLFNGNTILGLK